MVAVSGEAKVVLPRYCRISLSSRARLSARRRRRRRRLRRCSRRRRHRRPCRRRRGKVATTAASRRQGGAPQRARSSGDLLHRRWRLRSPITRRRRATPLQHPIRSYDARRRPPGTPAPKPDRSRPRRAVRRRCHADARAPASRRLWSWPSTVAAGRGRRLPSCRAHHQRQASCQSARTELRANSLRRRPWEAARVPAPLAP